MEAHINLTGNVGGDVEFRNATIPVASFRLACTPRVKREGAWVDGSTTWLTVTCFRGLAENVTKSLRRGDPVLVSGRLRTSTWTKDGVEHERLVLEASSVGHDLSWGSAVFQRTPRAKPTTEAGDLRNGERDPGPEEAEDADTESVAA